MKDYGKVEIQHFKNNKKFNKGKLGFVMVFLVLVILLLLIGKVFAKSKTYKFINPFVGEGKINDKNNVLVFENLEALINEIEKLIEGKQGLYGVFVKSLNDSFVYGVNEERVFTAASINKLPIVVSYLIRQEKGDFSFSEIYRLKNNDIEDGSGTLINQKIGSSYTYDALLRFIGKYSDNTATNVLIEKIGEDKVEENVILWKMFGTSIVDNKTTPKDMVLFLGKIYKDEIFGNTKTKDYFFELFVDTEFEDRIPAGIPEDIIVSHKIGNQVQVWSDCGVVFGENPYVICILTDGISEEEARVVVPKISKYVWDFEKQKL